MKALLAGVATALALACAPNASADGWLTVCDWRMTTVSDGYKYVYVWQQVCAPVYVTSTTKNLAYASLLPNVPTT